jgi:hypothetical protein
LWSNALLYEYSGVQPVIRIPEGRSRLDIAGNDPRYGPRRSRHARSRYHSRRPSSSLDGLSRRYRRVLHDLLPRCRRRAQPPTGAHVVPISRQIKLRCAVSQEGKKKGSSLELEAYRRSCMASLEAQGHFGTRKLDTSEKQMVCIKLRLQ